jgi:hypothetical protein
MLSESYNSRNYLLPEEKFADFEEVLHWVTSSKDLTD